MEEMIQEEQQQNSVEFEIEFYENILAKQPHFVECTQQLAVLYTKVGKYEKGLVLDRKLSRLQPKNPAVFYNLACSYSLLGNIDSALRSLKRAIILGFNNFDYMCADPDLTNARRDRRFQWLIPVKKQSPKQSSWPK